MLLTIIKNLLLRMMVQQSSSGCSCIAGDSVNSPFVSECSNCEWFHNCECVFPEPIWHYFPDCWAKMKCKAVMIGWKFSYGWRCLPVKVLLFHWFTEVNFTVTESSGVKFGRELNYVIGGGRSSIDRTGHKPGIKWNTHSPQAKTMHSLLKDHVSWCYSYKINVIYTG